MMLDQLTWAAVEAVKILNGHAVHVYVTEAPKIYVDVYDPTASGYQLEAKPIDLGLSVEALALPKGELIQIVYDGLPDDHKLAARRAWILAIIR